MLLGSILFLESTLRNIYLLNQINQAEKNLFPRILGKTSFGKMTEQQLKGAGKKNQEVLAMCEKNVAIR